MASHRKAMASESSRLPLQACPIPRTLLWCRAIFCCSAVLTTLSSAPALADPINVCLIETAGWVNCDESKPTPTFTGVDVELFRTAAIRAGWQEGVTYQFVCYGHGAGWSALARKLATNGTLSTCAVGSGAFALSSTRQDMGLQLSYPYFRTGLGVLVASGSKHIDMFAFIKPFTTEVWVAFLVTIMAVPMLTWLVEQLMQEGVVLLDWDSMYEARQATYTSILAVFNLNVYKVKSLAAQVLIITFCFVNLIVMATYIANLAAVVTNITLSRGFSDMTDLRGRRVAAHSTYQPIITSSYGVQTQDLDFGGAPTFDQLKAALSNRSLDAYVMDLPEIGYYVMAQNDDCSVRLLPRAYALIDFGFLFHKDFDPADFANFNRALFKTLEANYVEELANKFLLFLGALKCCTSANAFNAVTFHQLAGLWIILGAAIGLALTACAVSVVIKLMDRSAPTEERKLSSMFVAGANARIARSMSRVILGGSVHGSVHTGGGGGGGGIVIPRRRNSAFGGCGGLAAAAGGNSASTDTSMSVVLKVRSPSTAQVFPEDFSMRQIAAATAATKGDGSSYSPSLSLSPSPSASPSPGSTCQATRDNNGHNRLQPAVLADSNSGGGGATGDGLGKSSSQPPIEV